LLEQTEANAVPPPIAISEPQTELLIPFPASGELYLKDIQATYPAVDWNTLDRLYISAGHYKFIKIGNLPLRTASRPLVISNKGGQVRVGGIGHVYLISLEGGANWVLTGRYDAGLKLGDSGFQGHQNNQYANTRGAYGILVDDEFLKSEITGIAVGGKATNFEISHLEVRNVGFAGVQLKTDNVGTATMVGVSLHDLYIHDTGGEGFYIGSTQAQPQHAFEYLKIYNCRVLRTGLEAMQLGQLGTGTEVYHNVFGPAALNWKDAFQGYQDNCGQAAFRYGVSKIYNNVFIGASDSLLNFFDQKFAGDPRLAGDYLLFSNNYLACSRHLGIFMGAVGEGTDGNTAYRFEKNYFRDIEFQRTEVYPGATPSTHLFRYFADALSISLVDNQFDLDSNISLTNRIDGINGTYKSLVATGNIRQSLPAISFNQSGLPPDFDYRRLEMWAATAGLNQDAPITYLVDDWVMYHGTPYRCILGGNNAGKQPDLNPTYWQAQALFTDDVRLSPSSSYQGIGLQDTP
jgi:hypothetical protein